MRLAANSLAAQRCAQCNKSAFAHLYTLATPLREGHARGVAKRPLKDRTVAFDDAEKNFRRNVAHVTILDRIAQKCANLRDVVATSAGASNSSTRASVHSRASKNRLRVSSLRRTRGVCFRTTDDLHRARRAPSCSRVLGSASRAAVSMQIRRRAGARRRSRRRSRKSHRAVCMVQAGVVVRCAFGRSATGRRRQLAPWRADAGSRLGAPPLYSCSAAEMQKRIAAAAGASRPRRAPEARNSCWWQRVDTGLHNADLRSRRSREPVAQSRAM